MLIYRSPGPWGPGVSADLDAPQIDGNFYDLDQRIRNAELNPLQPVQISYFAAVGNQMFIYMSDGTVRGPLTMPQSRWFFRGPWLPSTPYAVDDVVSGPDGATYIIPIAHTSATA